MSNRFIPRRARCSTRRERCQLFVLGIATIYEGLVAALSLGFWSVETRSWLLFDVFDDD